MAERYSQGALNWHSHGILWISSNRDLRRIFWGLKFSIWDFFVSENLARIITIIIIYLGGGDGGGGWLACVADLI